MMVRESSCRRRARHRPLADCPRVARINVTSDVGPDEKFVADA